MRMRSTILMVSGVILIAAAAILKFAIVPSMAQFPDDVDTTRTYSGTVHQALNAQALAQGDLANLFLTDIPVEVSRHVTTEEVDGGQAIAREQATVTAPDGTVLQASDSYYAIDRSTMESVEPFSNADAVQREGLVIGWPIGTEARDYTGWSDTTQQTVTLEYLRSEEHEGVEAYVFESSLENVPIPDPSVLGDVPTALPKSLIGQLIPFLDLPEDVVAQFTASLADLPDPLPLSYLYTGDTTYWVEPATGMVIDIDRSETHTVAMDVGIPVPVAAVWDWDYQQTDASVADAVTEAEDNASLLSIWGTWVPLAALVIGLALVGVGIVVRQRSVIVVPETSEAETKTPTTT